jgi:hypothetical protein
MIKKLEHANMTISIFSAVQADNANKQQTVSPSPFGRGAGVRVAGHARIALELAVSESQTHGFQYIRTLNSDYVPRNEFLSGFRIEDYIRLRLTDADADVAGWNGLQATGVSLKGQPLSNLRGKASSRERSKCQRARRLNQAGRE